MRFENADHVIKLDNLIRFMKRETFFCLEQSKDFLRKIFKSFKIEISTEYRRVDFDHILRESRKKSSSSMRF